MDGYRFDPVATTRFSLVELVRTPTQMESLQSEFEQHQVVQLAAYYLWEQRGCPFGTPELDWFRAEEQLAGQRDTASTRPILVAAAETIGSTLGSIARASASVGGLFHSEATSHLD